MTRGRKQTKACYVYRIFDGCETVYVGKGSGRRLEAQKRRFNLDGEVIERDLSDDDAFARGQRRYAARFLLTRLNEANCGRYGVSKVDVVRLREVANGPWC